METLLKISRELKIKFSENLTTKDYKIIYCKKDKDIKIFNPKDECCFSYRCLSIVSKISIKHNLLYHISSVFIFKKDIKYTNCLVIFK